MSVADEGPWMRRLILFRHAKTEARAPEGEDIDRRLLSVISRDDTDMPHGGLID